jgi:hypothetical protein
MIRLSSSVRVSMPLRRSLPKRRLVPDRFPEFGMAQPPKPGFGTIAILGSVKAGRLALFHFPPIIAIHDLKMFNCAITTLISPASSSFE